MQFRKNKLISVGLIALSLAIILKQMTVTSDVIVGICYGFSITILLIGLYQNKKNQR